MAKSESQLKLRLSPELKAWIVKMAADNKRSLNNEVLVQLEIAQRQYGQQEKTNAKAT